MIKSAAPGTWQYILANGRHYMGCQIDKVQKDGKKFYRFAYSQSGFWYKKYFENLQEAKQAMIDFVEQ